MKTALLEVSESRKEIGQVLGLGDNLLSLDQMVMKWLRTSKPTLRKLVGAIATQKGGHNPNHAKRVARLFDKGKLFVLIIYLTLHTCMYTYVCVCGGECVLN